MATVIRRFLRLKEWRDIECLVIGGGFRNSRIGELAIGRSAVLLKADGLPTYHLANVVDDHLMGITHILRGEEWIPSAPKHVLLYEYFGWELPELCHLPLLRNPDRSKLSKRKNPVSILFYERMGYLPEALLNYLGLMAWSMPDERDKFSLEEMVAEFDIDRISLGGPVFDLAKPTLDEGETLESFLANPAAYEDVDVDALGAREYHFVRLNQLALEHAIGAR